MTTRPRTPRKFSKDRILRAVATSTAIETREPVWEIEARLREKDQPNSKFAHLQLAN